MTGHGPLNLSDADLKGFEALPVGRYNAAIYEITWDAVKNAGGKMPIGTPIMKVTYTLTDEGMNNRRAWQQFVVPPNDYDAKKRATMTGMIARFFIALGFTEEQVTGKKFQPDFEDLKGRPVVITLGREPKKDQNGNVIPDEYNNPVKGVKAPGEATVGAGGGIL